MALGWNLCIGMGLKKEEFTCGLESSALEAWEGYLRATSPSSAITSRSRTREDRRA